MIKHIYILLFCLIAPQLTAQNADLQKTNVPKEYSIFQYEYLNSSVQRSVIWADDFSDPSTWTISDAYSNGYDKYVKGLNWQIGTEGPKGEAAISKIRSTTADNNFALIDSDYYGDSVQQFGIENSWIQTKTAFSTKGFDKVSIRFETQYYMWDNGTDDGNEYCLVELSYDGVNWPNVETFSVGDEGANFVGARFELWPNMRSQDAVNNPTVKMFNISDFGADQDSLYVRFRWKGSYGYAWMIDDVEVVETPQNDATLNTSFVGDIINDWELYSIPNGQEQAMTFGVGLQNFGLSHQIDHPLTIEVSGAMDYSTSFGLSIGSYIEDTLWLNTDFVPTEVGVYNVSYSVPEDDYARGNEIENEFERTEYIMGHFNPRAERVIEGADQDEEYSIGAQYELRDSCQLGGVRTALTVGTSVGMELFVNVFRVLNDDIQDLEYIGGTIHIVEESDLSGNPIIIPLEEVIALGSGERIVVELSKLSGPDRLYVLANPIDDDFSTIMFGDWGPVGDNWYIGWDFTPWVDLVLDPSLSIPSSQNLNFTVSNPYPNPTSGDVNFQIDLLKPSVVKVFVRDLQGRIVIEEEGVKLPQGKQRLYINTSGLSEGTYVLSVDVQGVQQSFPLLLK